MSKHGKMELDDILSTLNRLGGAEGARKLRSGELKLVPRDSADLLRPLGDTIELPAVTRFVAKDICTKANGIAWMGDTFQKVMLPLVEQNIPSVILTTHELLCDSRDLRIAAALDVDEKGPVSLAHFLHLVTTQRRDASVPLRTDGWATVAYILGVDGNVWAVDAHLGSGGWDVRANSLGYRLGWYAGHRFLSR